VASNVVDSLLMERSVVDTFDCDELLLLDSRDQLVKKIISRIDYKEKVYLLDPYKERNPLVSKIPQLECYVGVRFICLLKLIFNEEIMTSEKIDDDFCSQCIFGLLSNDGTDLSLEDLGEIKRICLDYSKEVKGMSSEDRKRIWNENFLNKINSYLKIR
jgi:hypothetical protein